MTEKFPQREPASRPRTMRGVVRVVTAAAAAWCAAVLLTATVAPARVEGRTEHTKAQAYSAALRLLRVDLGYEVLEKDPDAAYLIFKYDVPGQKNRSTNGTVEIVEAGEIVKLYVKLANMPEYHERVLRDDLLKKLNEEYGAPTKRRKKPEKPTKDAGVDAGKT